jgi:hypothetical protein
MGLGYTNVLVTGQADSSAVANTTTATSILPSQARLVIPGGYLSIIGQMLTVEAAGRVSTNGAGAGTLQFTVRAGPTSTIAIATSPAFTLNTNVKTNVTWRIRWDLTLRAVGNGTTANFMHTGDWLSEAVVGSPIPTVGGSGDLLIPATAPAVGTGFDSTVDNTFDLFAQWNTASVGNSIQTHQYRLISWN